MIEVAHTDDSLDTLLRAHVDEMCKYTPLRMAQYVVKQQNYVIGIQGSINEQQSRWRQ